MPRLGPGLEAAGTCDAALSPLDALMAIIARPGTDRKADEPVDAYRVVQRRAATLGLRMTALYRAKRFCIAISRCALAATTFRAARDYGHLDTGGSLENAQLMAAHQSPRTTKRHDRTGDKITLDEVGRIAI